MGKFSFMKKSSHAAPDPDENPYAQPAKADPYAGQRPGLPSQRSAPAGALPPGPQANPGAPPPPYSGYGSDKYGASGGYGSSRYEDDTATVRAGSRGPGGYGGLGRVESVGGDSVRTSSTDATIVNADAGRDTLFAGARQRHDQQIQQGRMDGSRPAAPGGPSGGGYRPTLDERDSTRNALLGDARERYEHAQHSAARPGNGGGNGDDGFDGYGERRELTAEELEAAEIQDDKDRIRELKQESAASSGRSLAAGMAALEASRRTMERLGAQGERLYHTEANLDLSSNHNKVAQDRTRELKTLNRSMFAIHIDNPLGAKARREKHEQDIIDRHRQERETREETRRNAYESSQRVDLAARELSANGGDRPQFQRNLAARSKFQFEEDSDDDRMEDQIEANISGLESVTKNLHAAGLAIGKELDEQNKLIDRIGKKSDIVDDQVRLNRERLARIK